MTQTEPVAQVILPAEIAPPPAPLVPRVPLLEAARKRYEETLRLLTQGQSAAALDEDYVHDVRVASRRLGEVARLLWGFVDKPTARAVDGSLKGLRRAMGDLRDLDVACEHLLKWRMPAPVKAQARQLAGELADKRRTLEAAARGQITAASVSGAMVVLARVLEEQDKVENTAAAEQRLETVVAEQARKRQRQMRRSFGQAARKQSPEALHEARIAVKKLRYVVELQQEVKKGLKRQIRELKRLQQLLGDHHDVHVIMAAMAEHVKSNAPVPAKRRAWGAAWRKWQRDMHHAQAHRAAAFFVKSYAWING